MATPIVMPQMGESIAEGTIVRWMKKVGDVVERDEPLFEISTDKVDAEIPSPAAGVLAEITVQEGETVAVNSVVGSIAAEGADSGDEAEPVQSAEAHGEAALEAVAAQVPAGVAHASTSTQPQGNGSAPDAAPAGSHDDPRRHKSSPLVRRIARDHNVDVSRIRGSGAGGRVTKRDILQFVGSADAPSSAQGSRAADQAAPAGATTGSAARPDPSDRIEIQPLSVMRRKIAEHMVFSRRTSAHVHSVFHVSFASVDRIREQKKHEYERKGAKLTYLAFIAKAVVGALRRHRLINASLDGDRIVYRKDIHLGVAVSLEGGLIVPVVKHADEKNVLGLSRAIADLAERARTKALKPEDVQDGTFTITNPGQFGAQFGMPIINQPQVGILGIGTIEKRPVVVDDAIVARTMCYLTLGYDHRLVDGATADQFMAAIKHHLEHPEA
jgi:2-oxoglutarate dehydrogenase E2 component (dihydrolipoamide succinyltransferase)